ncbi:hypothetical protein LINPERPRIM_LOCUS42583 [Linum perenne]
MKLTCNKDSDSDSDPEEMFVGDDARELAESSLADGPPFGFSSGERAVVVAGPSKRSREKTYAAGESKHPEINRFSISICGSDGGRGGFREEDIRTL